MFKSFIFLVLIPYIIGILIRSIINWIPPMPARLAVVWFLNFAGLMAAVGIAGVFSAGDR